MSMRKVLNKDDNLKIGRMINFGNLILICLNFYVICEQNNNFDCKIFEVKRRSFPKINEIGMPHIFRFLPAI